MDELRKRLIHLHHCRGIGWKTIFHILKMDPFLASLYDFPYEKELPFMTEKTAKTIQEDLHSPIIEEQIRQYSNNQIHVITIFDEKYPQALKQIYDPPWVLYGKGDAELLRQPPLLAVVGSRNGTDYGKKAIAELFPSLIKKKITIVSGLAKGIDTYAHKAAIRFGGKTIAVIAGGIFHIYPAENKELALYLMKHHLVISEFPPDTKPIRWHFPTRNRIISGLCQGTFIVEAKERSGALITADYALQEGREVFALPGNIFNPYNKGTNRLIQQGAKLVAGPEDIIEELLIDGKMHG